MRKVACTRALVHAWHRGVVRPVHAGSKQGDQAGCSGLFGMRGPRLLCISRHAMHGAAATISACAAGRGYYLGAPRAAATLSRHAKAAAAISAGLRHGYYLGMRGAAATISACAAGRGYTISACKGRGCYLGRAAPRLLSRHGWAVATISACKGRGLSRQGCATATISACAGRGYYLGAPRLLSRHACAGNARVCSRRLSTARRDAARPAGHRCSGRPGDGRSKQC